MSLPYKVATLLYCFNEQDEVLLLERAQEPNRGLWSPCGGKLKTDIGESPYACACREAREEIGLDAFGYNIENRTLVAALEERAAEISILSRFDDEAETIVPGAFEVAIHTAGGQSVATRLVVGADGRHSRCR